jgi:hypothetical protein
MTDAAGPEVTPAAAREAADRAHAAIAAAVSALRAGAARDEILADFVPERRVLGLPRAARMMPIDRVWRLGVLLLTADGSAYGTGRVVRAERQARRSITAEAVAEQRAYRAAAVKGGIAEGETVNFDASRVDLDQLARSGASGPLVLGDDGRAVFVRWSPSQPEALSPLERYLADRVELLVRPPEGA